MNWTDIAQTIAAIGTLALALIGFPLIIYQIRQLERAVQGDTQEKMFSRCHDISQLMLQYPEVRPYILDGAQVPQDDQIKAKVIAFVEILGDFLELLYFQRQNMTDEVWQSWDSYIHDVYKRCPELAAYYGKNAAWYYAPFLEYLRTT